ncbi:hypothetical protein [Ferdinandcohnia sp. Marseille-Q9671]
MKRKKEKVFDPNDTYGVLRKEMEIDTDVNEDMNRENLLDDSLDAFLEEKGFDHK